MNLGIKWVLPPFTPKLGEWQMDSQFPRGQLGNLSACVKGLSCGPMGQHMGIQLQQGHYIDNKEDEREFVQCTLVSST